MWQISATARSRTGLPYGTGVTFKATEQSIGVPVPGQASERYESEPATKESTLHGTFRGGYHDPAVTLHNSALPSGDQQALSDQYIIARGILPSPISASHGAVEAFLTKMTAAQCREAQVVHV